MSQQGSVVVGVDGSEASRGALAFALEEALRRGVGLEVVTAWLLSAPCVDLYGAAAVDEGAAAALSVQDRLIAEVSAGRAHLPLLESVVVHGDAGTVLLRAAEGVGLLVLGHAPPAWVASLGDRSVLAHCLRNAQVPVVVVPLVADVADDPGAPVDAEGSGVGRG